MPLTPGEQLGPYEIVSLLGKGGMGEVYKARDPRLQRDVAIKTSAQRFSERFQIEARAIAALNHPNICQIYDVGPNYIVMEYVEGESPKGPLEVDEALRIAQQIALALADAHEKRITHRDLKPGNILVKADGTVKVLDFGLAKFGATPTAASTEVGDDSPTLTMAATQAGMILGTAAYMSPEQARGKPVDTRADIWSFGVVLYEIVTGEKPFKGEDLADTLATVVKIDPDLNRVPQRLRRIVQACLQKDPQQRLQAIGDMRLLLGEDVASLSAPEPVIVEVKPKLPWLWPSIAALFAIAAGTAFWMWRSAPPLEMQSVQFPLSAPPDERFVNTLGAFGVSPDGRYIVFAANGKNGNSLWLRSVDSMAARPLPGTSGPPNFPFWSPDSKSIVFTADGKLKRVEITGGAALTLAESNNASVTATGTWSRDGVILFGSAGGIQRTSASGGGATLLTKVDPKQKETGHGYPQFLPDGKRFLYFAASDDTGVQGVYASSLDAPQQRTLVARTDAKAVYVPPKGAAPGYLLWVQEDKLVAQRFNLDRLEREGDPVSVAENVPRNAGIPVRAAYWASDAGLLVYLTGATAGAKRRIVWMSRDSKLLGDALPEADIQRPALSPDGTRLAISRNDGSGEDIGVWEFSRSVATRLTFEKEQEAVPVWSPDSKQIAYLLAGKGLYLKDASGTGQPELLLEATGQVVPLDWSRDGKYLLYRTVGSATDRDIWGLPLGEGGKPAGKPFAVITAPFRQEDARFSPNGKWISFTSNESGKREVYIQPFVPPGSGGGQGGRWQVSNASGFETAWRGDGKELYYLSPDGDIMAAAIREEGQGLKVDAPRLLAKAGADTNVVHAFDVSRDGEKFVVQLPPVIANGDSALTVVTNWQAALRK